VAAVAAVAAELVRTPVMRPLSRVSHQLNIFNVRSITRQHRRGGSTCPARAHAAVASAPHPNSGARVEAQQLSQQQQQQKQPSSGHDTCPQRPRQHGVVVRVPQHPTATSRATCRGVLSVVGANVASVHPCSTLQPGARTRTTRPH
jgi:hypothetical protein